MVHHTHHHHHHHHHLYTQTDESINQRKYTNSKPRRRQSKTISVEDFSRILPAADRGNVSCPKSTINRLQASLVDYIYFPGLDHTNWVGLDHTHWVGLDHTHWVGLDHTHWVVDTNATLCCSTQSGKNGTIPDDFKS
uniref:Uncharacterized protein n=1 Tax=Rhodnius prolixus TaxID=13249 RepID=T1IER3_RHOPR